MERRAGGIGKAPCVKAMAPEVGRHPEPVTGRPDPDCLMTVEDVARLLGVSGAWVRQHSNGMRRPSIPSVKLGKSVRFRREAVLEFIRSMERCA
jgi:excisionase family DNA binding protein